MSYQIAQLCNLKQIGEIIKLHDQVWGPSMGILDLLRNSSHCFLLLDSEEKVIGYAFTEEDPLRHYVELQDIVVAPEYRKQGAGKALMLAVMKKYTYIKLIASEKNTPLIEFYRNLGFQEEMVIENYYQINQDGLRMFWRHP